MGFSSWLRSRQRHGSTRPRPSFRPTLEALEGRWVPSQIGLSVTSLADSGLGSLRAAILTADAGSHSDKFTIGVAVSGTINLQSPLPDLNNNIAIQGPGAASLTVERAAGFSFTSAIVTVDAGQTASLSGLTIANGNDGGIANHGGTLTVSGCTISGNSGVHFFGFTYGGGIWSLNDFGPTTLTVSGCTITGNSATLGGGIVSGNTLTVSGCTISGNSAEDGGGIACFGGTISGCTLSGNYASYEGGGIQNDGTLTVSGCIVSGNSATVLGGGIENDGILAVSGSTLSDNSVTGELYSFNGVTSSYPGTGGAIFNSGVLTVSSCTLAGNSATGIDFNGRHFAGYGGGIYDFGPFTAVTVTGSTLSCNSADDGGGIFNLEGTLTVRSSAFSGNSASGSGGAIYNSWAATVRDSLFNGNSAELGGAIYNAAVYGALDVRGSTFSGNSASDSGGGIYNLGTATIQESTLSGNTAGSDGGGLFNAASGTLAVKDSTVLDNSAPLGGDLYNAGFVFVGDSVIGDRYDV